MSPIGPPDSHHLVAALGWLDLGLPSEADKEMSRISPALLDHPDILEVRWDICAAEQRWETGLQLAERLMAMAPDRSGGWVHRAYALRRVPGGGLEQAWEALRPAFEQFPTISIIPFNLACYAAQLGRHQEAMDWLRKAVTAEGDEKVIKAMALNDTDLEALWPMIREW
jgi:tetratricopeptide (TPR) repeat protein